MKILLVGCADSIFLINYVKYIKEHINAEVHVYSPVPSNNNYDAYPYDYVYFEKDINYKFKPIKWFAYIFIFLIYKIRFAKFLRKHKKENYDIIHFHRILPAWVIGSNGYKKYCKKTVGTFWGGEIEAEKILFSHRLYLFYLRMFVKRCDYFINTFAKKSYTDCLPNVKNKAFPASFGSSIIDEMNNLDYSSEDAKLALGIPKDKITVLLGYSGKELHRHSDIIDGIVASNQFEDIREKIHIIISNTRNRNTEYCDNIEKKLESLNIGFTTFKGRYSTDKEIAILRKATDIVFQLSGFDGLSASIRECVCAGSILISGKWLNYNTLKKDGFIFYEVDTFDDGITMFYNIMNQYYKYRSECKSNKNVGTSKYSWEYCIIPWAKAYQSIMQKQK